jgi:hypothetical protein
LHEPAYLLVRWIQRCQFLRMAQRSCAIAFLPRDRNEADKHVLIGWLPAICVLKHAKGLIEIAARIQ